MGPPGSGKGTVCKKIVEELNYRMICAGDLLRNEKSSGSELGTKIAQLIDSGNLVPDNIITQLMFNEFHKPIPLRQHYLVDGYPRTVKQASSLDGMIKVSIVLWLNVSDETTIKRNLNRGLTSGRPDDSSEEIIKKRIENYKKQSLYLKQYYTNKIVEIDGEGTPDEVYSKVQDILFQDVREVRDITDIL